MGHSFCSLLQSVFMGLLAHLRKRLFDCHAHERAALVFQFLRLGALARDEKGGAAADDAGKSEVGCVTGPLTDGEHIEPDTAGALGVVGEG
jgi:hypothetical protein